MKILTSEEIEAHRYHTLAGGVKGAIAGLIISGAIFKFGPMRYPKFNPKAMTWSIKTATFIMPPVVLTAICAENASTRFDEMMYGSGAESSQALEEHKRWKNLSMTNKMVESLSNNKYKIITGLWAASLWGSWVIVNRDKIMTKTQKAVQARMYAQFITVALLLASMGLSMYEQNLNPDKQKQTEQRRWDKLIEEAEREEKAESERSATGFKTNQDRVNAKIYKYD